MTIIAFDVETTGVDPTRDLVIQFAAIVVDSAFEEIGDELEVKIRFDASRPEYREALEMNSYDEATWEREAVHYSEAQRQIDRLFERHKTCRLISKRGRPYRVAQGMAFNGHFDVEFVKNSFYRNDFMPLRFHPLDVLQLCLWHSQTMPESERPKDLKLETWAAYFDVEHDAHDAMGDVRATIEVAKRLHKEMRP